MGTGGIVGLLQEKARGRAGLTALVGNRACRHPSLTYGALLQEAERMAAGFLELGLQAGDRVGLVAENSDLWLLADLGLLSLGAVDVPRGGDASAEEVAFCVTHAECTAAVVETAAHVDKLAGARPGLDWIVVLKGTPPPGTLGVDDVLSRGAARLAREPGAVRERLEAVGDHDLATIIYTSGTTGNPKGVMLTHGNILHNVSIVPLVLDLREGQRFLSILPVWHTFERTIEYVVLDAGLEIHYSTKRTAREDFRRVRPHFACAVPRLWEAFYNGAVAKLAKLPNPLRRIIDGALEGSRVRTAALRLARCEKLEDSGALPRPPLFRALGLRLLALMLWPAHALAEVLVYRKLRETLGGRLAAMISGGGPLPAHVDEFLTRAGLPLLNGYGLTESSPVISVRRLERNVLGTIGPPIPFTEARIVDESGRDLGRQRRGVIQVRGPQVMSGYWRNEPATRRALPGDGWLDTGDVGMLSSEGDIIITGRAKDTLVLRGGENVEPEPLEAALTSSPYISEALIVGHGQKTLAALLVPDVAALRPALGLAPETPEQEIVRHAQTAALLRAEVADRISRARGYRNFELIGRVQVLETPFSVDDGTLTATLKKRRSAIEAKYGSLIQGLFRDEAAG